MNYQKTARAFNQGKIIVFPTDTVWGIGCSLEFPQTIKRLYQIKGRTKDKPTAVLAGDIKKAQKLGRFSGKAMEIAGQVWPGKVTLIVPAKKIIPKEILGKKRMIGIRIPNHVWLLSVLKELPLGIVASSANLSGQPAPLRKTMLNPRLIGQVDMIVSQIKGGGSSASAVIDTTTDPVKILRK